MDDNETDRGEQTAEQESRPGETIGRHARRGDRRMDGGGLFGGYQGPERRSGRDRRSAA